jgi:predicted secreted Zn-dependent protease
VTDGSKGKLVWHRSSQCQSGACVEAAADGTLVEVRNSTEASGASVTFSHDAWRSFIAKLKDGTSKQL